MSTSIAFSSIEHLLNPAEPLTDQVTPSGRSPVKIKFLTLVEAGFLSQQPLEALLAEGEIAALNFFVRPPADTGFCLYNERSGETADPAAMRTPNILVLPPAACRELVSWKQAQVRQADLAASLSASVHGDQFRWLKPNECGDSPPRQDHGDRFVPEQWTHWKVTLANGAPVGIEMSDLRVLKADVERKYELELLPRGSCEAAGAFGVAEQRQNYKSDLLQFANQAALKFWGPHVDETDSATYPDTGKIVQWLRERDETLSESLAESIASVIRPEFAGSTRVSREPKAYREPPKKRKRSSANG